MGFIGLLLELYDSFGYEALGLRGFRVYRVYWVQGHNSSTTFH